jgi:Big-like domain-containing protein
MEDGIQAPSSGFGPGPNLLVENSYLRNWRNINVPTPSSVNGCWMEDKLVTISNTRFDAPPGRNLSAINMVGKANGVECLTKLNEVRVYAYNGDASENFQVYHPNSAVLPRPPGGCTTAVVPGIAGLLNPTTLVSAPTCPIAPILTAGAIISPAPGSTLTSDAQLFQWSAGVGVASYQLNVGTFEGGSDIYLGAPVTTTSATVTGLPTHGGVIWARLFSNVGGAWQYVDASYTAAGVPLFIDLAPRNMVSVEGNDTQTTPSFNATAGDLILAFVASSGPGAAGQTMTVAGGGLAWSLVKRANSQFGVAEIWKATAAADLTGITVTSTPTQSSPSQSVVVITFAGTGGVGASAAASGALGGPSVSLTATKTGSFVYGVGNDWNGSVSRTLGTNQTMVHEYLGPNGDTFWVQRLNGTVPLIGTLITLNDSAPTDHTWNFAAVEIIPMQRVPPPMTWPTPADIVYGTPLDDTQLNATTEVAGTFVYTPPAGTVLNAGANQMLSVTFTPANSTTIYGPATATVSLNVTKAPSFVTWLNPADIAYGTALSTTQLNATANLPGTLVYSPAAGTILSAGNNQPLSVTFTPDDPNYQTVVSTVFVNVTATTPVVLWNVPAPIVYGTALSAAQLNASAGVPGTFVYSPAAGTVLAAGSRSLSVTFTPTDTAFAPSIKTVPLTVLKATAVVTWPTPANIVAGTALSATQLNATVASPAGSLVYSPAAGTVLAAGPAQRLTVTFTPTDTANYNVVSAAVPITVVSAAAGATPAKIGTTIAGTFNDATGHSGQSHMAFAPNANVWWMFTLSSTSDALGNRRVQTYASSGPDLATATWSLKTASPTLGNVGGATSSVLAGGRSLGVAVRSISGVDYAHVFISAAFDGQTSSNGHIRAQLGASTITWPVAWDNPGSPNTASEWQGPLNSGNPPSAAATHTSWGNSVGISTGGFIHHYSVTMDQEVDCAVGRSTNADTAASWTNGFGSNVSPTGQVGTSPPWTVAVIDKTMTNECKAMSFAPLASNVMLAVYTNGAVAQPNITNLRYMKSGSANNGTWTNISASTGGGDGNVFSSTANINQNDWALVPVNTSTIYAFRRKAAGTGIDAAAYSTAGNSWAAFSAAPPTFGSGQAFKAGGGLFGATDGTNVWLFVINTDTANSVLYTQFNGTSWTAWATVPGTGTGSQTRNFITGNPTIGSGQAGLAWTQTNGSNFDVYATSFRTATAAAPATVAITAPADASTVATTVNVTANATPGGGTIAGVQFLLDGANLGAEDTTSPYSVSWNTTTATNGTHFLTAIARDTNGGTGTAPTVIVTVANDLTAPTVTMTAPANGTSVAGASVSVSAEALDDIGVAGVQFLLDGVALGAEHTTAPYIINWNASASSAGTHTLSARARDGAGRQTTSATISVTVSSATPSISWPSPASIVYGTALSGTQLNASASVPGTFAYTPPAGTVLPAGASQTLSVTFTPTDTTAYSTATANTTITVIKATPSITWPTPASIVYGTVLSATQLNASAGVQGTFAYTPVAGTVLAAGTGHTLSVTLTPTDTANYTTATASVALTVTKATPSITWPTPAAIVYGTTLSSTQLNATTSVPGTFAYTPVAGTVLPAGAGQTLSTTFTPTDPANYTTATASVTITVTKATPSITWPAPANIVYGTALGATQLNATTSVPGTFAFTPAAGTVLPAGAGQTLSTTFTPTDSTNYTTATANASLTVLKAAPIVSWAPPASIVYGTALGATQLNATADVAGSFVYSPAPGTVLDAGVQTLSTTFTPTDGNYASATTTVALSVTKAAPVLVLTGGHFEYNAVAHPASGTATGIGGATVSGSFAFVYTPGGATPPVDAGSYAVTATFTSSNPNYSDGSVTTTITIDPADPDPTWPTPADIVYGTPLGPAQLNALAAIPGTYVYNPPAGTVLNAGNGQVLSMTFTPTSPNYRPYTETVLINVLKATPVITWGTPADINGTAPLTATQLNATANVAGTFVYAPAAGTVLPAGNQTLSVTFTPGDSTNYTTASKSVTLRVRGLPSIAVTATAVTVGATVTATATDGPANKTDWIALYPVGGATYLDWKYLNGSQAAPAVGMPDAVVPFAMPMTAGSYQLKFFSGSTLLATSATITVTGPTLSVSASTVIGGSTITATVGNGPGNARDWVGVYSADGSTLFDWKYLNGSQTAPATGFTAAAVAVTMPTMAGAYSVRLYANGALLASAGVTVSAASSPTLTVSATTVTPGGVITATVANGPANARDWIALSTTSDVENYLDWKYLNGTQTLPATGLAGASVSFTMPSAAGTYVLRFYTGNTLLASSAPITVAMPSTTLTVNATTVSPGSSVAATVVNGPGGRTDWIAIYPEGSSTYLDWRYLNGTQTAPAAGLTSAVVDMPLPTTLGNYTLRLYTGSILVATSATITVSNGSSITLSATTVAPGGSVSATVLNGTGNRTDWVGLFVGNSSTYVDWKYLNGSQVAPVTGMTTATVSFSLPAVQGTYTIRLLNGSMLLAVSPTITAGFAATMTVSATAVAPAETLTATVANGPGLPRDWIGVYPTGSATLLDWKYLNGSQSVPAQGLSSAAVPLPMPTTPGSYVLRFATGSTILATRSVTVQ